MDNEIQKEEMIENEINDTLLENAEEEARIMKVEDLEDQEFRFGEVRDYESD